MIRALYRLLRIYNDVRSFSTLSPTRIFKRWINRRIGRWTSKLFLK